MCERAPSAPSEIDLIEALSHQSFSEKAASLSARDWTVATRPHSNPPTRKRRRFGEVGDAVVQVLRKAGWELRMIERRRLPVIERVGHGRYRLIETAPSVRQA